MICTTCNNPNKASSRFCAVCGASLLVSRSAKELYPSTVIEGSRANLPRSVGAEFNPDDLIGNILGGKYRIDAQLGAGGMGQVYRATRLSIGDEVAVKILQQRFAADQQIIERFHREARAAAQLKHPNVVTIYDFGAIADGMIYLVMEMIEGKSLREVIRRNGVFTPTDVYDILAQICAALNEAHYRKIVHRDLKPENIIVSSTTHGLEVKVVDFGIAKILDSSESENKLTQTGALIGTPSYMSPEQCQGLPVDGRSDIYSLGIMLYEMLTGITPFNAPTFGSLLLQHISQPPPPMRSINISVPPAIEAVVLQALEKLPASRQQTAYDLAKQFQAALADASQPTSRPQASFYSALESPRTPTQISFSGFYSGDKHISYAAAPANPVSRREKSRSPLALFLVAAIALIAFASVGIWWQLSQSGKDSATTSEIAKTQSPGLSAVTNSQSSNSVSNAQANSPNSSSMVEQNVAKADANALLSQPSAASSEPTVSIEQLIVQADIDFNNRRYNEVINVCLKILSIDPNHLKVNTLLGQCYYNNGSEEGIKYLIKVIALGGTVSLPIKHHHFEGALKIDEGFCEGYLSFHKDILSFHSNDVSAHSFNLPFNQVNDLRNESHNAGRVHIKIPVQVGNNVTLGDYNFHAPVAGLTQTRLRVIKFCNSAVCQPMADTVYKLIQHLKP
jgi:serine/threonine protein kinase